MKPYVEEALDGESGVFIATSDYQKSLPLSIAQWIPGHFAALGTDGFGLSESRESLRDHFGVSADWIVFAALSEMARAKSCPTKEAKEFAKAARLSSSGQKKQQSQAS